MKTRFDELLPFYVNGTLEDPDREWVDTYLREHPKSAAELQWYRTLEETMKRDAPAVSAEVGLDKVMARIRAERAPARAKAVPAQPSLGERVRGWLAALAPQPLLRPALAGALAVVVVQGIVIANLATTDDEASMTTERVVRATPSISSQLPTAMMTSLMPMATGDCCFHHSLTASSATTNIRGKSGAIP